MTDGKEQIKDGTDVGVRDFASKDIEVAAAVASPPLPIPRRRMGIGLDNDKQMNRTISFQDGEALPGRSRRNRRPRSASVSSIGTTDEDDDDILSDDGNTGEDDEDELDDDGRSVTITEASDMSDEDLDENSHRRRRNSRFKPAFISRGQERRRRKKRERQALRKEHEEELELNIKSYRRTPVLTGVIAPFSIMLEIPGFTSRWYVRQDATNMFYRPNPPILDVGLAFSLASAVVANIAILGRFSERLTPRTATLTAGLFLILHDLINSVALISFGVIHAVNDGFTYSEAYWMTTAATGASLICTTSLIFDYVHTKNFRNAGSGLTPKQAQLVMVIMAFLAYISISAMIFSLIMPLPFLDSMYFMVESLATVGLGDITPVDLGSRIALFFVAPGGIVLLAVVIGISRQTIIEEFENAYKRRRALFKQKAAERQEEKKKNRHLRIKLKKGGGRGGSSTIFGSKNTSTILSPTLTMSSMDTSNSLYSPTTLSNGGSTKQADPSPSVPVPAAMTADGKRWFGGSWTGGFSRRAANMNREEIALASPTILDEKDRFQSSPMASNVDLTVLSGGHALHRTDTMATTTSQLREAELLLVSQRQEIEENFHKFRKELAKAERNEFWLKLSVAAILFACFWLVGATIFSIIEGWTYFQGFYFVFVVFTSIGYGDLSPKTSGGRAFFIVWGLLGVGTLTILFSVVSDAWANRVQQRKLAGEKVKKKSTMSKLADKIRGDKGRERRRVKAEKKAEEEEEKREEKKKMEGDETPPKDGKGTSDGSPLHDSSDQTSLVNENGTKGGGILIDPNKDKGSVEGSVIAEEEEHHDANQLHMEFTSHAMEFHRSALDFMQQNRSNVVDVFRHFPEMRELARKISDGNASGHKHRISEHDRKRLLDAAKEMGDANAMQTTHQWLLIQDFEHTLHLLVEKSSTFHNEVTRMEKLVEKAKEEIESLKSRRQTELPAEERKEEEKEEE